MPGRSCEAGDPVVAALVVSHRHIDNPERLGPIYEHSGEGKSDVSTTRSVPMTDRLTSELKKWRLRTVYGDDDDLVFAHPELGVRLDRIKVSRRFREACAEAGVRKICFHDLRHTFGTRLAPGGSARAPLVQASRRCAT